MLPRNQRLRKAADFRLIWRRGRGVKGEGILLKYAPAREASREARWGIVVSNKAVPRATRRNRIKRILREALRTLSPNTAKGFDGILIVLPEFLVETSKAAREALRRLLTKASLLQTREARNIEYKA